MKIKFKISEIDLLIDRKLPIMQVHNQLLPIAEKANLLLPEQQAGVDYLQWSLPEGDWTPFRNLDDAEKPEAAKEYIDRKEKFLSMLGDFPDKYMFLTVPDEEEHIFFRKNGLQWDIALVAWGYKFPQRHDNNELEGWISKLLFQDVNIGFTWDNVLFPSFHFVLQQYLQRVTGADGLYRFDNKVIVGKELSVATLSGKAFTLTVEHGKCDYIYDLTQYYQVDIDVKLDGQAAKEYECQLQFGTKCHTLTTNEHGCATIKIPLCCDSHGEVLENQPMCIVNCKDKSDSQTPVCEGDILHFSFAFENPKLLPPPPPPPPPVEYVTITLLDYAGCPLESLPFTLITKMHGNIALTTDDKGQCKVEKNKFTDKEKVRVEFSISEEYQEKHDIHKDSKKSKKKQ